MSEEKKTEKKKAESIYDEAKMGVETAAMVDRQPFGGLDPESVQITGDRDQVYLIDASQLGTDYEANGRFVYDTEGLAAEIRRDGGVLTPLTISVFTDTPGDLVLADLTLKTCNVEQGNRRKKTVDEITKLDPEFAENYLYGRIPVKIWVNPTPEELLRLKHDHSGQRGLSEAEVLNQGVQLRRAGFSESRTCEILWNSIVAAKPASKRTPMIELDAKHAATIKAINERVDRGELSPLLARGEVTAALQALWKARKAWARRFIQTVSRLHAMTPEIYDYMMVSWVPELALERGLSGLVKLTTTDFEKLGDQATALRKQQIDPAFPGDTARVLSKAAVDAAITEIFESLIKDRTPVVADENGDGGDGEGEGEGPTKGRSLSKKELETQAKAFSSKRLARVFLGIAGDLTARESWAEVDAILTAIEAATDDNAEILEALMADPTVLTEAYAG